MSRGIDGIESELTAQRDLLMSREAPYARALELLVEAVRGGFGERLASAWENRDFNAFYERPLLLLAALRYDALTEGPSHPLAAAFTGPSPDEGAVTREAIAQATTPDRLRLQEALRSRAVQTNETTRAVAWLWPSHLLARAGCRRNVVLVDLGTSAGLNLVADALPAPWTDEFGAVLAIDPRPHIVRRLGLDIAPLDVRAEDAAMWLRACVWPSDAPRLERLDAAIERFIERAESERGPRLEICALPDAPSRIEALPADAVVLCLQTIVRDYLNDTDRERYERAMRDALRARPPLSTLWAELELHPGGGSFEKAAAIVARFVDASGTPRELVLAHTHPHPRQVFVHDGPVEELLRAFTP